MGSLMLTRTLFKIMFLGEVEIAIRPGIKSRFGVLVFSTSKAIWICVFFCFLFSLFFVLFCLSFVLVLVFFNRREKWHN